MKPVSIVLTAILFAMLASFITVKTLAPRTIMVQTPVKESAYDRVMRTRIMRCGYVTYPPYFIKDANTGKMSGIFYDLTEKMGKLLSLKIDWSYETSFATFLNDSQGGRYDVFCGGLWPESAKSFGLEYSHPVNYVGLGVYVRADDTRFDADYTALNDPQYRFAALDGEMSQIIRGEDFPKSQELAHPQNTDESQLLLAVTSKKADAVIVERAVAEEYMQSNPGALKDITHGEPIRVYANTWSANNGEDKLMNMINVSLDEMINTGYVQRVVHSYEKVPGSFYPVAKPYQLPNEGK